jgi:hypothetical protein
MADKNLDNAIDRGVNGRPRGTIMVGSRFGCDVLEVRR